MEPMAFKRSAVRSRLSPPQNTDFCYESRCFSNFLEIFVLVGQHEGQQMVPFQVFFAVGRRSRWLIFKKKSRERKLCPLSSRLAWVVMPMASRFSSVGLGTHLLTSLPQRLASMTVRIKFPVDVFSTSPMFKI